MVTTPRRELSSRFSATAIVTVPVPLPALPDVTEIQDV
jgi:hypothetical protein